MFVPLVMVRILTPDQVGLFKIFFLYLVMTPLLSLTTGLLSGLGYWAGQGEKGRHAIATSNAMILSAGVLMSLVSLAASPWITNFFKWPAIYSIYFSISIIGAVGLTFLEESSIVTGEIWFGAIYTSSIEIIRSAAIVLTALYFRNLDAILMTATLLSLVKVGLSIILAKRRNLLRFSIDWEIVHSILKYSLPVSFAWFLGIFVGTADQVVLSKIMNPGAFAVYAIGCLMVPPLMILEQSITRVMIPQMSESFAAGNFARAAKNYRDGVEQLAWLLIPAVIGLIVFSRPIIEMLFTTQYSNASIYLRWFALSYLMLIFPHDAVPRARGQGRWILKSFMVFAAIPLILCYFLGMKYAEFGALAGLLISRLLMRTYSMIFIRASTGWSFRDFIPFRSIGIFSAVGITLGLVCMLLKPSFNNAHHWFLICGFLFTTAYLFIALVITNWHRRNRILSDGGRVLLFSQHLGVGGLERLVLSLGQTLQKNSKWKVFVFSHDSDENADAYTKRTLVGDFIESGIPVDALKKNPGFSFITLFRLVRNIYKNQIDVIHSHDMGTLIYAVLAKFFSLGRVRIVHTQHSFVHLSRHKRYSLYEKIFTQFVDTLTVVNHSLIEPYKNLGLDENKIRIVNNGVSFISSPIQTRNEKLHNRINLIRQLPESDQDLLRPLLEDHWILYLARFHSVKGQREVPSIWKSLTPELRQKTVLLMIGPEAESGEYKNAIQAFEGMPDRDRVIFLDGTKSPQDWIAAADLFLSCSKFEGMPLGPLEAIGSGLPAVLSGITGHRFLEKVSQQYSLDLPDEGARLIENILCNPEFGSEIYYQSLWEKTDWIRKQYSLNAMAEQYTEFYTG